MEVKWAAKGAMRAAVARERIQRTGFAPGRKPVWTDKEIALLAVVFPDYHRAARALGRRTYYSVRNKARSLGLTGCRHTWTAAEVSRVRRLYPTASMQTLLAALPGLSLRQIAAKAGHIGVQRKHRSYAETGFPALDEIRERAFRLNLSMVDLDAIAGTKSYFQKAEWCGRKRVNYRAMGLAAEALDGLVSVRWRGTA